jgi:hypothetical protein
MKRINKELLEQLNLNHRSGEISMEEKLSINMKDIGSKERSNQAAAPNPLEDSLLDELTQKSKVEDRQALNTAKASYRHKPITSTTK